MDSKPDAIHKVCEIFQCCDVVVMGLKRHIRIDVSVGKSDSSTSKLN